MRPADVAAELEGLAKADDFVGRSSELVEAWSSAGAGLETIDPILRFIETHPDVDFGSPGPLVHFAERFYLYGYEEKLLQSIARKPTSLTAWMVNRVLNGTKEPNKRQELVAVMKGIAAHPLADDVTRQTANRFADRAGSRSEGSGRPAR